MVTAVLRGLPELPFGYFILNIDPILVQIGSLAVHWYGLAYVVAISVGLWFLFRWTRREGIHDDQVWTLFIWAAVAGLVGGRLYFVVQQANLVDDYLLKPWNILAVWNGGMAFFGAIFLGTATLFALAPRYGLSRFIVMDGGAFFAAVGQIFGRFGNIINGDILGLQAGPALSPGACHAAASGPWISYVADPHILSWAVVYANPASFANGALINGVPVAPCTPFQPAPVYEMLMNLAMLAILWPLRYYLPRVKAGLFFLLYLAMYAVSQFVVFFWRGSEPYTPFLGIDGLKQAQWTALIVLLVCVPLYLLIQRFSASWPFSEKRPVPWPQPAFVVAPAGPSGSGGPGGSGGTGMASRRTMHRGAAGRAGGTTTAEATPDAPAVELPPWQPYRARGGELRNAFATRSKPARQTSRQGGVQ